MGCIGAKSAAKPPPKKDPAAAAAAQAAAERRKKLNPADYIISKRTGEVIVKEEGTIAGEQFNIEECKDCDIFLFDVISTSFIDECEGCRIFVGPVETSIFVRNCNSCDFVIACQQFRSRDCADCRFALHCTTEPIIETSTNMQFACFDFTYFSLRQQLDRARLKLWNNKWWQVYDFNKNPDGRPNWGLLPQEEASGLLRPEACSNTVTAEELAMDRTVPITLGSRAWPSQESCFVLFPPDADTEVEALLGQASRTEGWWVCRARSTVLSEERLKQLLGWAKDAKLVKSLKGKEVTGLELCGPGIARQVREAVAGSRNVRIVPEQDTPSLGTAFFETWKDMV